MSQAELFYNNSARSYINCLESLLRMTKNNEIKTIAEREWYLQGFNGTPFLVSSCAASAFDLEPSLGDKFSIIVYDFQEERADMFYPQDDLERLGKIIRQRLTEPTFLTDIRDEYLTVNKQELAKLREVIGDDPKKLSDDKLLVALDEASRLLRTSVAQAHMIEPFALTADNIMKQSLSKYIDGPELNQAFALLTTPLEKSFAHEREEDLHRIAQAPAAEQDALIKQHLARFHWVRNSYADGSPITAEELKEELQSVKEGKKLDLKKIEEEQKALTEKLGIDEELQRMLKASAFLSAFQDERKKNILIGVGQADWLLKELSTRIGISQQLLRYLDYDDDLQEMVHNPQLKEILEERRAGLLQISRPEGITRYVGQDFKEWRKQREAHDTVEILKELNGLSASPGHAIGRVHVCNSLDAIKTFEEGDILVAAMTRPEYLPAMKKAAAIITDEGGISCHAAIVSREMGTPCVIGTKHATKLLKDGDLVEVRANHGLIIVIERSEVLHHD